MIISGINPVHGGYRIVFLVLTQGLAYNITNFNNLHQAIIFSHNNCRDLAFPQMNQTNLPHISSYI